MTPAEDHRAKPATRQGTRRTSLFFVGFTIAMVAVLMLLAFIVRPIGGGPVRIQASSSAAAPR